MPNCGSGAWAMMKFDWGTPSFISTVDASMAVTDFRFEFSAHPKTAPK
jgi:hypothetical protein